MEGKKWYYKIWFVVAMLLVAGPFAFPLLWKSSEFSRPAKWVITILFLIVTVLAVWGTVETGKYVWKEFQSIRDVIQST